jgi:hypothetical protein
LSDKRYQVFISSTFEDLREERRAVQDTIIQLGDFPVQMESFPAADEGQLPFIKSLIRQCDYYVLVIGGRYGTVGGDGLSYTHKEYRYAVEQGVPVLVIVHDDRGKIPAGKSETTDQGRKNLEEFIQEAIGERLRTTWSNADELKLRVREALDYAKATKPRVGWVRGDAAASYETLEELNRVRRDNEKYRDVVDSLEIEIPLPSLPDANGILEIDCIPLPVSNGYGAQRSIGAAVTVTTTWISAFPIFFSNLKWHSSDYNGEDHYGITEDDTAIAVGSAYVQEVCDHDVTAAYKLSKSTLDKLCAFYIEAGLMRQEGEEAPFTNVAQKFARRHRLTEPETPHFLLSRGTTSLEPVQSRDLDDEIPF